MHRHGPSNCKENTPPPKSVAAPFKSPAGTCKRRLPLGRIHAPSNRPPLLEQTPMSTKTCTRQKPQVHSAPPAALPSTSPEMLRKKGSSRDGMPLLADGGCFGIGPTVHGSVKDRRKSKPRALLTVEPLPDISTLVWDDNDELEMLPDLPGPGRASLEWISEPESGTTDSLTSTDTTMDMSLDHPRELSDLMSRIKLGTSTTKPASSFYNQILGVTMDGTGHEAENESRKKTCRRGGLLRCTSKVVPTRDTSKTARNITLPTRDATRHLPAKHKTPLQESQGRYKRQCKTIDHRQADPRQQINLSEFLKASRDLSQQQAKFYNPSMLGVSGNRKNAKL